MTRTKKSQAVASGAATLIAIIAGLIILYILFLPPSEREELLDDEDTEDEKLAEENISIIFSEAPKRLFPTDVAEFEQELPSVLIYVGEEAVELKKEETVYVSKSLFKETKDNVTFEISDLANTKNVLLNFEVNNAEGRLLIGLNNYEVYNAEITAKSIDPIELRNHLQQGVNTLEFAVSSPGIGFWKKNEYSLEDVLLTADVVSRDTQISELTFVLGAEERNNLEKVKLHFYAGCNVLEAGKLDISINNYNLYSSVPDCGSSQRPLEFAPERLNIGENNLVFETDKGRYLLDNVKISSELKDITPYIYYFELNETQIDLIENETMEATIYLRFADDETDKEADVLVNNHAIRIDQTEIDFEDEINNYVEEGNNAIKIEPEEILDIVELKVIIEEI